MVDTIDNANASSRQSRQILNILLLVLDDLVQLQYLAWGQHNRHLEVTKRVVSIVFIMLFQSQSGAILYVLLVDFGHLAEETALVGVGR